MGKMRGIGLNSVEEVADKLEQRVFEEKPVKRKEILEALSALQKLQALSPNKKKGEKVGESFMKPPHSDTSNQRPAKHLTEVSPTAAKKLPADKLIQRQDSQPKPAQTLLS